jgi:peptidoglycan-associated lipoprotein
MKTWLKFLVPVAAFVALAACGGKGSTVGDESGSQAVGPTEGGGVAVGTAGNGGITGSPLEAERARLLQTLVIYFDYDQAEIKPEFAQVVQAHGQRLASSPSMQVRLEGHTDERGSREYNIGLGERRAHACRLERGGDDENFVDALCDRGCGRRRSRRLELVVRERRSR